jgi:prepilin-type N-terminal cleavage/methylation domain-containing protein
VPDSRILRSKDEGFTLIELLVVMIIIGVLAAIAIPLFLTQQAKAHDASTKTDVANLGKEIATYYVDGGTGLTLDLDVSPGRAVLSDGRWTQSVKLTNGTAKPASGATRALDVENGWCISLTDPKGHVKDFRYSALDGLEEGTC